MTRSFAPHRAARAVMKRAAFDRRLRLETLESRLALAADFGDAPAPYPTTLAENGARHEAIGPTLGATRDTDTDGSHSAAADGDGADDDGVAFGSIRVGQLGATATVNVQNAPAGARLDAWIDFNADGSWGAPGEQIADRVAVAQGDNTIRFDVPSWAADGETFARFRLSTAGNLGMRGGAADGEVEDFSVELLPPFLTGGEFAAANTISAAADGARRGFVADMDGDGDLDVLSASLYDDKIAWYENDGNRGAPGFTAHTITTTATDGAEAVVAADLDGDGDMDVLSASAYDNKIAWFENNGAETFMPRTISTSADEPASIIVSDMDADGDLDVVSASQDDDRIAWYENNGNQLFTPRTISTTANRAISVATADVDGDGDMDVLSASVYDDKIAWYENDGSQGFIGHDITTEAGGAWSVATGDLDGDGDTDVLSASGEDDKIAWHENDGNQRFATHVITTQANGAGGVFGADMDGDGDLDVLSASFHDGRIAWYRNEGDRTFVADTITTAASGAWSVFAGDVDGDGDLDVLSVSANNDTIAWYENENPTCGNCADQYSLDEDGSLIVDAVGGLLSNDEPQPGESLIALVGDPPNHGMLMLALDGSFQYVPDANFFGVDDFTYRIASDRDVINTAVVTITVRSVNDLPTAGEDEFTLQQGTSISLGTAAGQPGIFAGTSFADPPTGATTFAGSASELGFEVTSGLPGTTIGVTSDDRFIARGTTSGVMTLALMPVDIAGHRDVTVRISARSFEDSTGSDFEPADYLRAYVALERIGGPIFTETIFDLAGTALKAIDTGPNGPFASYSFSIPNSGFIRATLVVEALVDSNSERVWVDDIEFFGLPVSGQNSLLANDSDADDDPLTVRIVTQPAHGTLVPGDGGALVYTPDPQFFGDDRFTYVVNDGQADSNIATVTLHVRETNQAPVARNDAFTAMEDVPLVVDLPGGLLANDTDGDNHPLSVRVVTQPAHGTLAMFPNGTFKYVPAANHHGADSFSYVANDARDDSNVAIAMITISAAPDAPTAIADRYSVEQGIALTVGPGVPRTMASTSFAEPPTGVRSFPGGSTEMGFTFIAGGTSIALGVTEDDHYIGHALAGLDLRLSFEPVDLTGDYDVTVRIGARSYEDSATTDFEERDYLRASVVLDPLTGVSTTRLIFEARGTDLKAIDTGPSGGFTVFAIDIPDGYVRATLIVEALNDSTSERIWIDDIVFEGTPLPRGAGALSNDTDTDGDSITASLVAGPFHGTLDFNDDGSFSYTPDASFTGVDQFSYVARDATSVASAPTRVTINVGEVNLGPTAVSDLYLTAAGRALVVAAAGGLLANDFDPNGDPLAATLFEPPEHGTLDLLPDGGFSYTPPDGFFGRDTFRYAAGDGSLERGVATVTIVIPRTIDPIDSVPMAAGDRYQVAADSPLSVPASSGVLANDADPEERPLLAAVLAPPRHGTLDFSEDGAFIYRPLSGVHGTDSFVYRATDGNTWSGESLVLVEVLGPGLPQGSVAIPMAGDVNRDGQVTAVDLSDVLRRQFTRLGMAAYDPAADANGDGRVTMQDAVAIRNMLGVHSTVAAAAGAAITAADEPNVARSRAQAIAQWPIVRARAHRGLAAIENSPIRIQDRDETSGPTLRGSRNSRSTAPSRRLASEAVFRSLFSEE